MPVNPPGYVLVAETDNKEKDLQIANMKAQIASLEATVTKAKEDNEKLEASLKAANVFNQGNGTNNINTIANTQDEPATKVLQATIAKLSAMVTKPIIEQILTARRNAGYPEDEIKTEESRLAAMTYDQVVDDYKRNSIFIQNALGANSEALFAKQEEQKFEFNGISNNALVGKTVSLDNVFNEVLTK